MFSLFQCYIMRHWLIDVMGNEIYDIMSKKMNDRYYILKVYIIT